MGAINTAAYLASIRSKMDAQQQVVALLETELQNAILGGDNQSTNKLVNTAIKGIYDDVGGETATAGATWVTSMFDALSDSASVGSLNDPADQDTLRQLLYQARALLGELRIEEQAWNGEVNSEKTLRKEVNDFAKV